MQVLYPLAPSVPKAGSAASALNARHLDRAVVSEEWWGWVRGNVSIVANHTALLGYYICDDCCPFAPNSQPIGNVHKRSTPSDFFCRAVRVPTAKLYCVALASK